MPIFNTDCSFGQIQTSFQSPQSFVCLQGGMSPLHFVHKETKQSKVQVSCWWLLAQVRSEETPPSEPRRGTGQAPPGNFVLTSPYMARYRSTDQQEWFHFPAAHRIIIIRRLERTLWLWVTGPRHLALSLSRGRRNCVFGRERRSDTREKRTTSLLRQQTAPSEPGPRRAHDIRREGCPMHWLRRADRSRHSGEGSSCLL